MNSHTEFDLDVTGDLGFCLSQAYVMGPTVINQILQSVYFSTFLCVFIDITGAECTTFSFHFKLCFKSSVGL